MGNDPVDLKEQFLYLLVDVFDVLPVPFVLPLLVVLLIGLFVLGAELAFYFCFLSALLLAQNLFNGGNGAGDGLPVLQNTVQLRVRGELLIRLARVSHVYIPLNLVLGYLLELGPELLYLVINPFEITHLVVLLLLWLLRQDGLDLLIELVNDHCDFLLV